MILKLGFIRDLSAFYMGVYLLYSAEPLCLLEPRKLYKTCFYSDKYGISLLRLRVPNVLHYTYIYSSSYLFVQSQTEQTFTISKPFSVSLTVMIIGWFGQNQMLWQPSLWFHQQNDLLEYSLLQLFHHYGNCLLPLFCTVQPLPWEHLMSPQLRHPLSHLCL